MDLYPSQIIEAQKVLIGQQRLLIGLLARLVESFVAGTVVTSDLQDAKEGGQGAGQPEGSPDRDPR